MEKMSSEMDLHCVSLQDRVVGGVDFLKKYKLSFQRVGIIDG